MGHTFNSGYSLIVRLFLKTVKFSDIYEKFYGTRAYEIAKPVPEIKQPPECGGCF